MSCDAFLEENKTQKEEGAWVEEGAAFSFGTRIPRWVITPLLDGDSCILEEPHLRAVLRMVCRWSKNCSVMDSDCFPFPAERQTKVKKWGQQHLRG